MLSASESRSAPVARPATNATAARIASATACRLTPISRAITPDSSATRPGYPAPGLTGLDWIIVGFTLAMALWGYAQGLIVGALSLAGFAAGAVLGARVAPLLLAEGAESPYAPLVTLICAAVIGGIFASGLEILGFHLRRRMPQRIGALDGLGGAVLLGCLGLGIAWIAGAVALQT